MTTPTLSAFVAALITFAVMRRRHQGESLAAWEQQLDDAYDLGRQAGRELYWLDALTIAPAPPDIAIAWNTNTKDGAADAREVMFARGKYDGWWEAANHDVEEALDFITREAA